MGKQMVIFALGQEEYAMPIEVVREITRLDNIRPIPQAPAYVKGLINIRGTAIPLINLRSRFGIAQDDIVASTEGDASVEHKLALITEVDGEAVGFAVDEVREIRVLDEILPPPQLVTAPFIGGIVNLPERIIMCLIPERILEREEIQGLRQLV
ncbi:chemotaxis protein CheW [Desulfitobacterium sp.]|uniref:chemotaxis protein CheW n=1 Tax=Desulfitobacterium sp. TaxID=49981 RepID=UPI002B7F4BCA|nr:chemotaxis protein CheW [Desulfitobacterium sp.]HVJ49570.1 chemotaxis protein CheW [Desulfitobacterium sp.]